MGTSELRGMDELTAALDIFNTDMVKQVIRPALRAGAKVMQKAAIANAPVLSGLTQQSVKVKIGRRQRTQNKTSVICYIPKRSVGKGNAFYMGFVEYGHRAANKHTGRLPRPSRAKTTKGVAARIASLLAGNNANGPRPMPVSTVTGKMVPGLHWFQRAFDHCQAQACTAIVATAQKRIAKIARDANHAIAIRKMDKIAGDAANA